MTKVKVFDESNASELSPIIGSVERFLIQKTHFEKMPQDKNNKTYLGGVGFYFDEVDGMHLICYDKHPKYWNEQHIKNDLDNWERYMAKQQGVPIHEG
jgi:hypothetical protein